MKLRQTDPGRPVQSGPQHTSVWTLRCPILALLLIGLSLTAEASLPALVQRQPQSFQKAWREIERVIAENEQLPTPLADPYLARADLWTRIGSHEDALADYLKATELFFQHNPTPGEQARHLARLRSSLEQVVNQPRPHFPSDAATQFSKGVTAFRAGDDATALACFQDCTRLMPDEPVYRAYRALTHHQLRQPDDARKQVGIMLSLVRAKGGDAADQMSLIHRGLEHVQGTSRRWLTAELDRANKQTSKPAASR